MGSGLPKQDSGTARGMPQFPALCANPGHPAAPSPQTLVPTHEPPNFSSPCVRIGFNRTCEAIMANKRTTSSASNRLVTGDPIVASMLTGIIYRARLFNRQAKVNIPEEEVISEVLRLWRTVMARLHCAE